MTDLKEILNKIDRLRNELDSLGPLDQDMKERLAQKIRLEWNYHSNVIEGNQLDWGETRSLLLHGLTANGKPLKDHLDMKGHNEALKKLEKIADKEIKITEKLIKEFHKVIIEDPFKEHPKVVIGSFKRKSNYLYNEQGERIDFVPPDEVPEQLNELINWTNNAIFLPKRKKKKYETHPLLIAAVFHLRFINIHPFDDGNGRICRILMNIILIQCGFPPIIIKKDDRPTYFRAIQRAREEGEKFLAVFLGNVLIDSLELYLKASRGEAIDEPDDLDKKLAVLEKELEAVDPGEEVKTQFNRDVLLKTFDSWFSELIRKAIPAVQKFNKFFIESRHRVLTSQNSQEFVSQPADETLMKLREALERNKPRFNGHQYKLGLDTHFGSFKKGGLKSFGCNYGFGIQFETIKYIVKVDQFSDSGHRITVRLYEKLLHKPLTQKEMDEMVTMLSDAIYEHIDHYSKEAGLR